MKRFLPVHTTELLITRKCNMNCSYCFEKDKNGTDVNCEDVMHRLTFDGKAYGSSTDNFYILGGEPMMNMDFLVQLIEDIRKSNLPSSKKKKLENSITHNLTTNGTLIDKYVDVLKKYGFKLQISLDGPEDINDACRVDYAGNGHFKQIMENIRLCRENGIPYSIHGAICNLNYKNFTRINRWFIEQELEKGNASIDTLLYHNYCQLVFEDDITDEDIDTLLKEYYNTVDMILNSELLKDFTEEQRKECACGFLAKAGGICGAANGLMAISPEGYMYPCHRLMTNGLEKREWETSLGNIDSDGSDWNYMMYERFIDVADSGISYGLMSDINFKDRKQIRYNISWCPSTNYECSGELDVMPCKYNVMVSELQIFIIKLAEHFGLDVDGYVERRREAR